MSFDPLLQSLSAQRKRLCPAVIDEARTWSYADFVALTSTIAENFFVQNITRVAICLPQSFFAYAAACAAYLSGTNFCPISVDNPLNRKQYFIDQFNPQLVLCSPDDRAQLKLPFALSPSDFQFRSAPQPPIQQYRYDPDSIAYTIFTTGTTGKPKGVLIKRSALDNLLGWASPIYNVQPTDRWGQYSNLGFDLSIFDIFMALRGGASLVPLATPGEKMLPGKIIKKKGVTIWHSVPSAIDAMDNFNAINADNLSSIRIFSFCGEPLFKSQVKKLRYAVDKAEIFNTYGPTEACILCSHVALSDNIIYNNNGESTAPIGKPIDGFEFAIEPEGEVYGELVLISPHITSGYLGGSDSTEAEGRTRSVTFQDNRYHTGDYVEVVNEHIYFRHRKDSQVKIKGFRVDLTEIEEAMRVIGCPSAKCLMIDGSLVAFFVSDTFSVENVRQRLFEHLPHYAIPSGITKLENMPVNSSGKVDTSELSKLWRAKS